MSDPRHEIPHLLSPRVIAAHGHPTRVGIMTTLNERAASQKELADLLDRSRNHIHYHLNELKKLDLVELVGRRGAESGRIEDLYRATERPWFDRDSWRDLDPERKPSITTSILANMNEDIAAAIKAGTFHSEDNHVSRTPMVLDELGREEVIELLKGTLEGLLEIQGRAAHRLDPEADSFMTKVHLIQFESPQADDPHA